MDEIWRKASAVTGEIEPEYNFDETFSRLGASELAVIGSFPV